MQVDFQPVARESKQVGTHFLERFQPDKGHVIIPSHGERILLGMEDMWINTRPSGKNPIPGSREQAQPKQSFLVGITRLQVSLGHLKNVNWTHFLSLSFFVLPS